MVHVIGSRNLRSESASYSEKVPMTVKVEIEGWIDEEHAPLNKRCKISSASHQQWSVSNDASLSSSALENSILDEPSPLGLRLKKSHSFLDLIETMLSKGNNSDIANTKSDHLNSGLKKETRGAAAAATSGSNEKLKASNFPATLLRIGSWEYKSKYEGDLVAKCYFAKHKLVWEVLEGELKSKIEIQWSDIMALKENCPSMSVSHLFGQIEEIISGNNGCPDSGNSGPIGCGVLGKWTVGSDFYQILGGGNSPAFAVAAVAALMSGLLADRFGRFAIQFMGFFLVHDYSLFDGFRSALTLQF